MAETTTTQPGDSQTNARPFPPGKGARQGGTGRVWLAAILIVGLALRLWGIGWGLPDSMHYFSFHPDETLILTASLPDFGGINLGAGHILPGYYNYGSLPFYLINIAVLFGSAYHWIGSIQPHNVIDPTAFAHAYLAARLLSVLFGVGTVWAVYDFGRRCFGEAAGLLAALLLAITPLHAQHSHYGTVDIGATFWQMLSLVFAAKFLTADPSPASAATSPALLKKRKGKAESNAHSQPSLPGLSGRWRVAGVLGGAIFAGLTAATKYSGILVLLSLLIAIILRYRAGTLTVRAAIIQTIFALIFAALAFAIACPGSVFQTAQFLHDVRYESSHVMHQGEIYFQNTGPGWAYILGRNLDAGMGLPLLLLSLAGVVYALIRRAPGDWLLLAFALPTYLVIGAAESRYARYEIPLLPIFTLWAARFVVEIAASSRTDAANTTDDLPKEPGTATLLSVPTVGKVAAGRMGAAWGIATLIAAFTLADCVALLAPMSQPDPRERAAAWLNAHAPAPAAIGLSGSPWFWSSATNPYFAAPHPGDWQRFTPPAELARYCYNSNEWLDPALLPTCRAPVVALTEYQYYDPLRLNQPVAKQYLADLRAQYAGPIVFASTHPIGGRRMLDGLPVQDLPHDMLYPSPTILIFTRR